MADRHLPPMRSIPKAVPAKYYNRVKLALLRLGSPLRIPLPRLGHAEAVLDASQWLCLDESRSDLPLMAWTDFEAGGRATLHEPVRCTVHLYHTHAGMLLGALLPELDRALAERLTEKQD